MWGEVPEVESGKVRVCILDSSAMKDTSYCALSGWDSEC